VAGLGNLTTTLITTRGLFTLGDVTEPGFTALTFGAGITPWFRLYINETIPPPTPSNYVAAAGSRVYQPGEFQASWREIDPTTGLATEEPWLVPRDQEGRYFNKGKIVTIKLVWGEKQLERQYPVNQRAAKRIVEAANLINATKERIKFTVSGFKKITTNVIVEARNFILVRKRDK
jgi:hypothetical protein